MLSKLFAAREKRISSRGLKKALKTVGECASIVIGLRDKPTKLDYAASAIKLASVLFGSDEGNGVWDVFDDWMTFSPKGVKTAILEMLSQSPGSRCVYNEKNTQAMVITLDGIDFGWTRSFSMRDSLDGIHVKGGTPEQALNALRKHFWHVHQGGHVRVAVTGSLTLGRMPVFAEDEFDLAGCLAPDMCSEISERVSRFNRSGVPRSMLFVGPPGTGKSTLIKLIARALDKRTLRVPVHEIRSIDVDAVITMVEMFEPEVLMIDDLDRASNPTQLLDGLEKLRAHTGIVMASMNTTKRSDPAFLRPGRFDEIHSITTIDESVVKQFVDEDDPDFATIKQWPIAYVREYRHNVNVMGEEYARKLVAELDERQKTARKLTEDCSPSAAVEADDCEPKCTVIDDDDD